MTTDDGNEYVGKAIGLEKQELYACIMLFCTSMHDYVTVPNFTLYWEREHKLRQHLSFFSPESRALLHSLRIQLLRFVNWGGLLNILKYIRRLLRGKFQKASNLLHLYDPMMAQYQTKVWNQSTTSSQIHPPSTGYIRSTIHYQSYRILNENRVNKAGVILLEWSFHCIQMNGINGKTISTTVVNKTTKIE